MNRLLPFVAAAVLCTAGLPAFGACGKDPECDPLDAWLEFTEITLELTAPGATSITWHTRFDQPSGIGVIDVDERGGKGANAKGTVATIGNVMLTKGLQPERGREIDLIEAPNLHVILLMRLLAREFPEGPGSLRQSKRIDRTDKVGIRYATAGSEGYLPPPWRLAGVVARKGGNSITYDLTLSFPQETAGKDTAWTSVGLRGVLGVLAAPAMMPDTSLAGWTAYNVDGKPRTENRFASVADVRAYLAEQDSPGRPDPGRDFTGFWKENCAQDFGLKIVRRGDEGKYAMVFCGPGGCDDPAKARLTFITGDKLYEVVDDDTLLKGRGSLRQRWVRCSRDAGEINLAPSRK